MLPHSELDILATTITAGLNAEQAEGYRKIVTGNFSRLLLVGEAGAGKTYMLMLALAQLHRQGAKVCLCAPTHLARVNMQAKLPEDIRHQVETKTTASLLSRFGFDAGNGKIGFAGPKADRLGGYDVIAIDEASMIGLGDYEVLKAAPCKVIFTGDFKQLPAIMQKNTDMMNDPDLELVELKQQMRAPGVIHQLAERNREEVFFPTEDTSDENSSVTVHATTKVMIERMIADIIADPRGEIAHPEYRFITYKNSTMYEVGMFVRDVVTAHQLGVSHGSALAPITAGEYMLNYETCPAAYNGEVVKVLNVLPDPGASHGKLWDSYKVEIEGSRGICWANIVDPRKIEAVSEHVKGLQDLLKEANKRKAFDAAKSYLDEIQHISTYWTRMFYIFAMTTHKSQGQTIPHVYCDTQSYAKASNKRALLYVGLSRASVSLHTVVVEAPRWKIVRGINDRYRAAKALYEELFGEPHWKARVRSGLGASTPEQKEVLVEYMECLIADKQQEIEEQEAEIELQDAMAD